MKRYKLNLPNPARCAHYGVEHSKFQSRMTNYLAGMAFASKWHPSMVFNLLVVTRNAIWFSCNHTGFVESLKTELSNYGVIIEDSN